MRNNLTHLLAAVATLLPVATAQDAASRGERVPESAIHVLGVESMDVVNERQAASRPDTTIHRVWNGQDGRWVIPSLGAKVRPHSGKLAIINEWGDPRIGIGFNERVDLVELWAAGHGAAPASKMQLVGFRAGKVTERSEWFTLSAEPKRLEVGLLDIDRVEILTVPHSDRHGFVAIDDIRFMPTGNKAKARVLDFEDLWVHYTLTGSKYAGLTWETGTGFRAKLEDEQIVPAPKTVPSDVTAGGSQEPLAAMNGTPPAVWDDFTGVTQGDPGANLVPPDTCGCNGPDHYVVIVNANLSAFRKTDKARVLNTSLNAFFGSSGTTGDPRIVFDPDSQRYFAMATDFSRTRTLFFAVSRTTDPTGAWFKWSFRTDQGTDSGRWPDYPTLGVDKRGIYSAAYMVGRGSRMTIWALDKAPLIASTPTVGTITAFRSLPWEGAIQPCVTYGDPGGEYLVSRASSSSLRLRRLDGPLTAPTLTEVGMASIQSHSSAPNAPALGSTRAINVIDPRPLNAVFRNGSVYTVHGVGVNGRSAVRWYEIVAATRAVAQTGTIADAEWYYYYGSVAVDKDNNVGIGFSGSKADKYASTFLTAHRAGDASGDAAPPVLIQPGQAAWNRIDSAGRNRFGDYSMIDVDAKDDLGFWTNQEWIVRDNVWSTRITRFGYEVVGYGTGLAGTNGIPAISTLARPTINASFTIHIGNSLGSPTGGLLTLGAAQASLPIFGGTLLVTPLVNVPFAAATGGANVVFPVPNLPGLINVPVYFQAFQIDSGAAQGLSFTRGLEVRVGSGY